MRSPPVSDGPAPTEIAGAHGPTAGKVRGSELTGHEHVWHVGEGPALALRSLD